MPGVLSPRGVREPEVQILSLARRPPGVVGWTRLSLPSRGVCSAPSDVEAAGSQGPRHRAARAGLTPCLKDACLRWTAVDVFLRRRGGRCGISGEGEGHRGLRGEEVRSHHRPPLVACLPVWTLFSEGRGEQLGSVRLWSP